MPRVKGNIIEMRYEVVKNAIDESRNWRLEARLADRFDELKRTEGLLLAAEWLVRQKREYCFDIEVKMRAMYEKMKLVCPEPWDITKDNWNEVEITQEEYEFLEGVLDLFPDYFFVQTTATV